MSSKDQTIDKSFIQEAPEIKSALNENSIFKSTLDYYLNSKNRDHVFKSLNVFESKIISEVENWGLQAETNPPELVKYSAWGKEINEIEVSSAWDKLKDFSAREGLIADGYNQVLKEDSRLLQLAKLYLFHPSSAFFSCPLAMTDGAATVLQSFKDTNPLFLNAFQNLTSCDSRQFWTSGQWMTEKTGGSDVSQTSTLAFKEKDYYLLEGVKWFSSATTSEIALGLARVAQASSSGPELDKKLSLFFIPVRNENNELNGIHILRLKDKLGTKALPTAELELKNTKAYMIGERGGGVKVITAMLNITRIYNSVCSVGHIERSIMYLEDYSLKRVVFGKKLVQQPLQQQLIAELKSLHFASTALTFFVSKLLGESECNVGHSKTNIHSLLRLLTPVTKLYTAKLAIRIASEVVEGIGGAGYIEDTKIPVLLRDAQVFPIWEGATHVLSIDMLRVLGKSEIMDEFFQYCEKSILELSTLDSDILLPIKEKFTFLKKYILKLDYKNEVLVQSISKNLAWSIAELVAVMQMSKIAINANKEQRHLSLIRVFLVKTKSECLESDGVKLSQLYSAICE